MAMVVPGDAKAANEGPLGPPPKAPATGSKPVAVVAEEEASAKAAFFFLTYEGFFDFLPLREPATSVSGSGGCVIVVRAVTNEAGE